MSYLGKASNDYACPKGKEVKKHSSLVAAQLVKIQRPSIVQDDTSSGGN